MMTIATLVKAVLDFLNRLFESIHNRKQEELGRLREAAKQAEVENALIDRINSTVVGDRVSDDEAFGGPPRGDLPGTDQK
jgi:hypothetical protein